MLQSRSFKPLAPYVPDLVASLSGLPPGAVLDGELISFDSDAGRTSFSALQRRVTAGRALSREGRERPATYVAFDVLHDPEDGDLRNVPFERRRQQLEELVQDGPAAVQICPQTTDYDEALLWLQANRRGRPQCVQCSVDERDPVDTVITILAGIEPGLTTESVAGVVPGPHSGPGFLPSAPMTGPQKQRPSTPTGCTAIRGRLVAAASHRKKDDLVLPICSQRKEQGTKNPVTDSTVTGT